ncbi:MAG: trehalose-6-phosphate synthase [Elusimicrobia bacterium RIFOXYC2_FULL_34_12]|nr:MAG: trehalose-6-phosphate synthase [Elusimicrobia bacterium RIFOXYC2_FULL_34_12]OGS39192.1 MAG: trehalose-6-phosphate synthase [Elusimicrobia bacterium RIFOXYD2_FULL_34_30]
MVSNRQPYVFDYVGRKVKCTKTIGGLVTAMDPVMQASEGVWVAASSGDADNSVIDKNNIVKVPPEKSAYSMKLINLTKNEEQGYYYGYSNQALWPLSHIAYRQPNFMHSDWETYKNVNKRFAESVLELFDDKQPFIWLQDYHLTLCAKYIKEKKPEAVSSLFWHIPWPNPEVFRVCPQKTEILEGLLANDLLGFHIKYHCHNFLETCEIELESKVDWEESAVTYKGHKTLIKDFPISVDFESLSEMAGSADVTKKVEDLSFEIDPPYEILALSIDRVDYTKGIIEKIRAVDKFLEKYPEYHKKFVFFQKGALSRLHIKAYKELIDEIQALTEEINWKYRSGNWYPIVLLNKKIDYTTHIALYRACDLCLVGSLHDGMNLVAKEFISANVDIKGILMLSKFTGAARELKDAVLVNPYDTEGFADAIKMAIEIPPNEKKEQIKRMREHIQENNIYKWAGKFISTLIKI